MAERTLPANVRVEPVTEERLNDLLTLLWAYCDFYQVTPDDAGLRALARALMADPEGEGVQFLALRDGQAVGFATVYWGWSTLHACRVGILNDLYVAPEARGAGVAEALVEACLQRCRDHGASTLTWQTAPDNHRAQAFYHRLGAGPGSDWRHFSLEVRAERELTSPSRQAPQAT